MDTFQLCMEDYRKQLQKGSIQKAYKGLVEYMGELKSFLKSRHPDYNVPGSLYLGAMDMTYFAFTPMFFQSRKLKIAIVFNHPKFSFEVWLAGINKQVQEQYWKLFAGSGWDKYWVVPTIRGVDSIVEHVILKDPNFSDLVLISERIEIEAQKFIGDLEEFLSTIRV